MTNEEYNARLDTLAAMAMQGLVSHDHFRMHNSSLAARQAYAVAEEMLEARGSFIRKDSE